MTNLEKLGDRIEAFVNEPEHEDHGDHCRITDWWLDQLIEEADRGEPLIDTHVTTDDLRCILAELKAHRGGAA